MLPNLWGAQSLQFIWPFAKFSWIEMCSIDCVAWLEELKEQIIWNWQTMASTEAKIRGDCMSGKLLSTLVEETQTAAGSLATTPSGSGRFWSVVTLPKWEEHEHAHSTGHPINWTEDRVIATFSHTSRRCLLESWMIHRETNHLNRELGSLPHIYKTLIRHS